MAKFIDVGLRVKARQQACRDQGLCACGGRRRGGISPRTKKPYLTCQRCFDRAAAYNSGERENKGEPIDDGVPFPITTTGLCYQVLRSGKVGVVVPAPCPDPLILEFKDGDLDVFHLRELELCDLSVSRSENSNYKKNKDGNMGRPKGVEAVTISKMFAVHGFLKRQSVPLKRSVVDKEMGFDCTRILSQLPSDPEGKINLETLGIVLRVPLSRDRWVAWELSELGREKGEEIIHSLKRR